MTGDLPVLLCSMVILYFYATKITKCVEELESNSNSPSTCSIISPQRLLINDGSGTMTLRNVARHHRIIPAAAVVSVLLITMKWMLLFVAANEAEITNDGEATNMDETTTTQNIVKILYCTS